MKKILPIYAALLISVSQPALAENAWTMRENKVLSTPQAAEASAALAVQPWSQDIQTLQKEWARIKYQIKNEEQQLQAIHRLENQAASVTAKYPQYAEPKIWEGIILSTDAGIVKGLSALGKVRKAKSLLEQAVQINPKALDGSAYTTLGSLYYQVPGWPVAFGDDEEAEKHLRKAIQFNPKGIDPNFFYADFLLQDNRLDEAQKYFNIALNAAPRPGRELADYGRKEEIKVKLEFLREKLENGKSTRYNN